MNTYKNALALLHGRTSKKIDNNTYARLESDTVYFKLHNTDIVTVQANGMITLNSGGWRTATTKDRMNSILHDLGSKFSISQDKGIWYVGKNWTDKGSVYADEMVIDGNTLSGTGDARDDQRTQKEIKKYVDGYTRALFAHEIKAPGPGDCLYCQMCTQDNKSLGDATGNQDHIQLHLEEMYFAPSLLVNAAKIYPISIIAKDTAARLWQGETPDAWVIKVTERDIKSSLTRYLKHALGIAA